VGVARDVVVVVDVVEAEAVGVVVAGAGVAERQMNSPCLNVILYFVSVK
jgi:hypothetical protein